MKKLLLIIILSIFLYPVCLFSQKQETRDLGEFSMIRVADNITAILVPEDHYQVVVDAKDIWLEEVLSEVDKKELKLRTKGSFNDAKITCTVYYDKEITKITPTYGGMIKTDSNTILKTSKLYIDANLDGFTNLVVDVDELYIEAGQGSDIYISGRATKVIVDATSGAKVHLENLICRDADAKSALGAKVWLTASNNYTAKAASGGKIFYAREPDGTFDRTKITGGKIDPME